MDKKSVVSIQKICQLNVVCRSFASPKCIKRLSVCGKNRRQIHVSRKFDKRWIIVEYFLLCSRIIRQSIHLSISRAKFLWEQIKDAWKKEIFLWCSFGWYWQWGENEWNYKKRCGKSVCQSHVGSNFKILSSKLCLTYLNFSQYLYSCSAYLPSCQCANFTSLLYFKRWKKKMFKKRTFLRNKFKFSNAFCWK